MKSILTILLISIFSGVLIFGTFAMSGGSSYCYSLCIGAIKIFSTTISGTIFSFLFLFIIVIPKIMGVCTARPCKAFCTAGPCKAQQELTHWLAIHENSPTAL